MEIVEHKPGTGWVVARVNELRKAHRAVAILLDASGPAQALLPAFEDLKIEVKPVNAKEHAQAWGMFFDAVDQATLRHLGTAELTEAITGAVKRPLGDAWGWSRKSSTVDISPLVAVTLAHWGSRTKRKSNAEVIDLNEVMQEMQDAGELTPILEV